MVPAHKRLKSDDLAVDARLGLIMQNEFAMRDRGAQVMLQSATVTQTLIHVGVEEADSAAAL